MIRAEQGVGKDLELRYRESQGGAPVNLVGYTVSSQIRNDRDELLGEPDVAISDAVNGIISLVLSPELTTTLPVSPPRHSYDVLITSPTGDVKKILEGKVQVGKTVTHV
jgi:hypothetical protein